MLRGSVVLRAACWSGALAALVASLVTIAPARADDDGPDVAVARARKLVATGDLPQARRDLERYVETHPRDLEPARYLGDLAYRAGDFGGAEHAYRVVLRFAPNDRETHDRLGGIYAAQDRIGDAIAEFEMSLPIGSAYGHLVELHRRRHDLAEFEAPYRTDADARPQSADAQYALGTIYRAEHRPAIAAVYLERALELEPTSCATLSELGSAYLDLDRVGDAVVTLRRCTSGDPKNYEAEVNLGDAYIEEGHDDLARTAFDRALGTRPDGPEALVDDGYLRDVADDWQGAVSSYLHAIAVDPLAREAYVNLGFDYDAHHLFALAEAAFLKGLSVAPGDGRLHYLLGETYRHQAKRELAASEFRAAAASDEPDVARAASHDLHSLI